MGIYEKFEIGISFIIIALIILFAGIIPNAYKIIERNMSDNYVLTKAEISDIHVNQITSTRVSHDVFVSFSVNEKDYKILLDTYVEGMKVGDEVEIYYDVTNPNNITLKWNQLMQLVLFFGLFLIFNFIGVILIKRRNIKENC